MCGESARIRFELLLRRAAPGRARGRRRSASPRRSRPRRAAGRSVGSGSTSLEQLDGERRGPRVDGAGVVLRPIGNARCAAIGPASSSGVVRWIVTPVSRVAGHDRPLDRRRAAPAREQRRVDVEPRAPGRAAPPGSAARRRRRRPCRRPSSRSPSSALAGAPGSRAARPSPSPAAAARLRPRPRGLSGRVSRYAISCCAASPSRTSAPNGAVAATASRHYETRIGAGAGRPSASLRASGVVRSRISTPSRWSSSCWTIRAGRPSSSSRSSVPSTSRPVERQRDVPLDRDDHALQREAALGVGVASPRSARRSRVDDRARLRSSSGWNTKMRCSTPIWVAASPTPWASCMSSIIARRAGARSSSNVLDLVRAHPQRRVGVLADLREREPPPRLVLAGRLPVRDLAGVVVCHGRSVASVRGPAGRRRRRRSARRAHRDGRGRESSSRGARGEPPRLVRLRDELRAVAAAQAEERRRAEQRPRRARPACSSVSSRSGAAASRPGATMRTRWRNGG